MEDNIHVEITLNFALSSHNNYASDFIVFKIAL